MKKLRIDSISLQHFFKKIEEIDQNIEKWVSHFIDQIEKSERNRKI